MKHVYSRTSTMDQNVKQQTELLLKQYGYDCKVWQEQVSGKNSDRIELNKMLEHVRKGDSVIAYDISRIGRNVRDVLDIVELLKNKKVKVIIYTLGQVDVTSSTGKLVLTTLAAVAEMQRTEMLEKQKIGVARARAEGKYKGKQQSQKTLDKFEKVKSLVLKGYSIDEACKVAELGRASYFRLKKVASL